MSLYPENLLPETERNALIEIQIIFDTLNNALSKSVEFSGMLDSYLGNTEGQFNISFPQLGSSEHTDLGNNQYVQDNEVNNKHTTSAISLTDFSKLGENILKVTESFGELPPQLKSLKSALGIFTETSETVSKATELFSGEAIGASVAGDIITGGEIAAGAVGVAEAASAFGPPGWVIALGALATAAVVSQISDNESQPTYARDFTPDKMKNFYWNEEREKDRKKFIELYHMNGHGHATKIETELDSDYMVQDRLRRVQLLIEDRPLNEYDPSNPTKKILAHNSDLVGWGPITKIEVPRPISHPLTKNNFSEVPFYDFTPPLVKKLQDHIQSLKKPDTNSYRLPTETEFENYQRKEMGLPPMPGTIPNLVKRSKTAAPRRAIPDTGSVININLNRPMIEHFTINASGVKEGLNDFKYRVEEILLEILNSANVIR